jgi:hypothetical protein
MFAEKSKHRLTGCRWLLFRALYKYQKSEGKINNINKNLHCRLLEVLIADSKNLPQQSQKQIDRPNVPDSDQAKILTTKDRSGSQEAS